MDTGNEMTSLFSIICIGNKQESLSTLLMKSSDLQVQIIFKG